jgi:Tol biopolymer transport system component
LKDTVFFSVARSKRSVRSVLGPAAIFALLIVYAGRGREGVPAAKPEGSAGPRSVELSAYRAKFEFRGRIVFQSDLDGDNDIYLLTGGGLRRLTDDPGSDEFPRWSPDGLSIAFSSNRSGLYQIYLMDADGTNLRQVTRGATDAIEEGWYPDGKRLAYTEQRKRTLGRSYALRSLDLATGETRPLLPDFDGSTALPDFSPAGPFLAFTGKRTTGWDAFRADLATGEIRPLTEGGKACRPRFSPDGAKIAFVSSSADGKGDVWLMNPDGGEKERLTDRPETFDYFPGWSPDGKWIVFASGTKHYPTEGVWELALVKPGTKLVVPLFRSGARDVFPDWR